MEERKLTEQESLQLIQQMIQVAKEDHHENGDGWLIWGWLLFLASLSSAVVSYLQLKHYVSWIWTATLGVGFVIYILFHVFRTREEKVKTYVQELLDRFGAGFFISLFTMIAAGFISKTD